MMEQEIAGRLLVTPHQHMADDHLSYVVRGRLGFRIGDDEIEVPAGSSVFRPRGVPHALWNPDDEPAIMLEITSPGRLEDYVEQLRALGESGELRQDTTRELASRFGITFLDGWIEDLSARHGVSSAPSFWTT